MTPRQWLRQLLEALLIDIRVVWFSLLVPLAVIYAVHFLQHSESCQEVLVTAASLLQILGIAQVAWGLHELRVDLGEPTLHDVFFQWVGKLKSLLPFGKRNVRVITGSGSISLGGAAAFARGVAVNPNSIESRVAALESQVKWLRQDLQTQTGDLSRRIDSFSAETRAALTKRQEETVAVRKLLDRVLIGGLDLEVAGLAWILIGQVLTTWPARIASMVPGFLC